VVPPGAPSTAPAETPLASAGCCVLCAPDAPTFAGRYCCLSRRPAPDRCTEGETSQRACGSYDVVYDEAFTACRAQGLWVHEVGYRTDRCIGPDGLSPTGTTGAHFKCCAADYFVQPRPGSSSSFGDCQRSGALDLGSCQPNEVMLSRAVDGCFGSGLVLRTVEFVDDGCGVGRTQRVDTICCRPSAAAVPPASYCRR
jgi:hypothetical protein